MFQLRSHRRLSGALLLGIVALAAMTPAIAHAQAARDEQAIPFDIPEQPLDTALAQYFRITNVQLLYDSALAAGHRSSRVKGTFTPREVLLRLLKGTGLIVRYSDADAAIITVPDGGAPPAPLIPLGRVVVRERVAPVALPSRARLIYYGQLETELHTRLEEDERTARLAFSLLVHLRISQEGVITEIAVHRGSGDRRTDELVADALRQVAVSPPPEGLQQPLAISLRATGRGHRRR